MNKRRKGLKYISLVKQILIARNHKVEGPKYSRKWIPGTGNILVHDDFFGCFDLLSCPLGGRVIGHQVTDLANKLPHARLIFNSGFNGDLWCYVARHGFNRYWVHREADEQMHIELLEENVKPITKPPKPRDGGIE